MEEVFPLDKAADASFWNHPIRLIFLSGFAKGSVALVLEAKSSRLPSLFRSLFPRGAILSSVKWMCLWCLDIRGVTERISVSISQYAYPWAGSADDVLDVLGKHRVDVPNLEVWVRFPAPTWQFIIICNSCSGGSDADFCLLWALQAKHPYTQK